MKERPALEYFKIDSGGKASLNKMHEESPSIADVAIQRLQNKNAKHPVHGEVIFDEQGRFDVLLFRGDLYHPSQDPKP